MKAKMQTHAFLAMLPNHPLPAPRGRMKDIQTLIYTEFYEDPHLLAQ